MPNASLSQAMSTYTLGEVGASTLLTVAWTETRLKSSILCTLNIGHTHWQERDIIMQM